ncbi:MULTISPECIES: glutamyl-tRNA reductase [Legionella]|uniref:glutamyl-tRNA reductase n=1 Tax=Legionella TaxID=445 RepID=UPI000F8E6B3E|nr:MULTISPECIES: glutamyl-tRNA reductase [Legionella]MCP0914084.1 glutamyl-tRNA reductase [Legionella sp. 27cVA30]RUR10217.1 glutamyl-tRNA reductase [Legionella septentrionalis]RUR15771.1 glutamyl-tRNA reductase [Legionella septentrionalis]
MVFVACGLNHKTAPLDVREKIALPLAMQDTLLGELVDLPSVNEAVILSTCNRLEIYCDAAHPDGILPWLAKSRQLSPEFIKPFFYSHHGRQGLQHTFRVASGLDSMMLGEPQILGQMKQAYQQACRAGTVKHNLRQVFQYVFRASKRIRTRSGIGNNPVSVAFAAVQKIGQLFTELSSLKVLLIGSGETSSLVAKYLHNAGVTQFLVASRNPENAKQLADAFAGKSLTIGDIPHYLAQADVVVTATACPLPFITKSLVEHTMQQRNEAPMFFLDLAVPRDIEADVCEIAGVHLFNIDDLQKMTEKGMDERKSAAMQAEKLIDCELDNYIRWRRSLQAKKVICDYRKQMQELAQLELQRAMHKLDSGLSHPHVLTEFSERLLNKLIHSPTVGLRQAAMDNREDLLDLAHYLFTSPAD